MLQSTVRALGVLGAVEFSTARLAGNWLFGAAGDFRNAGHKGHPMAGGIPDYFASEFRREGRCQRLLCGVRTRPVFTDWRTARLRGSGAFVCPISSFEPITGGPFNVGVTEVTSGLCVGSFTDP